ncbi:MAG: CAP domain-containing protein [Chitinophagales bacterium]
MRKITFLMMLLAGVASAQTAADYLARIPKYNESSQFEDDKYKGMTWQQFEALDMAKEFVDPDNYDYDLLSAAIFFATNKYRASQHIAPLVFEGHLRDAAAIHTYEMIRRKIFDHINQADAKLKMPNNRTELCGYAGERIAENLERDYVDLQKPLTYMELAEKAIRDLSRSKEHNAHMLDPNLKQVGCAIMFEAQPNSDGYWFWRLTQDFGKPWDQ